MDMLNTWAELLLKMLPYLAIRLGMGAMNCFDGFVLGTRVMVDTPPTQGCSKPVMLLRSNSGSLPQRSGRYREFGSLADIFVQDSHWPERGYGAHLDLRIYVYLPDEIEGLVELVSGRDRSIRSSTCVKGQWGSQVIKSRDSLHDSILCTSWWVRVWTWARVVSLEWRFGKWSFWWNNVIRSLSFNVAYSQHTLLYQQMWRLILKCIAVVQLLFSSFDLLHFLMGLGYEHELRLWVLYKRLPVNHPLLVHHRYLISLFNPCIFSTHSVYWQIWGLDLRYIAIVQLHYSSFPSYACLFYGFEHELR